MLTSALFLKWHHQFRRKKAKNGYLLHLSVKSEPKMLQKWLTPLFDHIEWLFEKNDFLFSPSLIIFDDVSSFSPFCPKTHKITYDVTKWRNRFRFLKFRICLSHTYRGWVKKWGDLHKLNRSYDHKRIFDVLYGNIGEDPIFH